MNRCQRYISVGILPRLYLRVSDYNINTFRHWKLSLEWVTGIGAKFIQLYLGVHQVLLKSVSVFKINCHYFDASNFCNKVVEFKRGDSPKTAMDCFWANMRGLQSRIFCQSVWIYVTIRDSPELLFWQWLWCPALIIIACISKWLHIQFHNMISSFSA